MYFKFLLWILVFSLDSVCHSVMFDNITYDRSNSFYVKVTKLNVDIAKQILKDKGFVVFNEIIPETFVVDYKGKGNGTELLTEIALINKNQVADWGPLRVYDNTLKPADNNSDVPHLPPPNLVCTHYYGMGVEDAWNRGYSGKGVIVAITDVGVNTDLLDLQRNIDTYLSFNFVQNNTNVTPVFYPDFDALNCIDHGNRVSSIVAAVKDNNLCSAGIAYSATIAAIKMYEMLNTSLDKYTCTMSNWTAADIISRALVHRPHEIDIFVNAWTPTKEFDPLDLLTLDAIEYGATKGRQGLGRIYVVPSGPPGNKLSNNIHTVTVGGLGQFGTMLSYDSPDASVIVSGLSKGNNLTSSSMVTTSQKNRCISSFSGLSAATAQIGGICALGLEANPNLSLRDVQHLLVHSADYTHLKETDNFKANGAGLFYHSFFGFGLVNASRFVDLAKGKMPSPELLQKDPLMGTKGITDLGLSKTSEVEFCFKCSDIKDETCLSTTEHVQVSLTLTTNTEYLKITIRSPVGTESVLMDKHITFTKVDGDFVSTHFWDELPFGTWKIIIQRKHVHDHLDLAKLKLTLFGSYHQLNSLRSNQRSCSSTDLETHVTVGLAVSNYTTNININVQIYIGVCVIVIFFIIGSVLLSKFGIHVTIHYDQVHS